MSLTPQNFLVRGSDKFLNAISLSIELRECSGAKSYSPTHHNIPLISALVDREVIWGGGFQGVQNKGHFVSLYNGVSIFVGYFMLKLSS